MNDSDRLGPNHIGVRFGDHLANPPWHVSLDGEEVSGVHEAFAGPEGWVVLIDPRYRGEGAIGVLRRKVHGDVRIWRDGGSA